jgi:antitoxin CcdA
MHSQHRTSTKTRHFYLAQRTFLKSPDKQSMSVEVDNLCYVKLPLAPIAGTKISYQRSSCLWTIIHMFSNMEMRMGKALEVRARKSTNVTLPLEVLDRAKELGINLSRASERGVREEIQETEARRWADDNAELVAAYTAMVERDGLPLAKYRTF